MSNPVSNQSEEAKSDLGFPVVGIGASAGGLEAIKLFISSVPKNSGMAYVYVQHLNPNVTSALSEILMRSSKIPVIDIEDDIRLEKDHLYIIPSNKMLTVVDGKLKVNDRDEKNKKIKIIDLFFSSLAVVHQTFAIGVILSGTLDDGSLGLQVIKANGGVTFVQDDSAAFDGMPHNAIKTGAADFVLPPDKIVARLTELNQINENLEPSPANKTDEIKHELYKQILGLLRIKYDVDFRSYKQTTIKRRLARRMALTKHERPMDYFLFLKENKAEQESLFNDMLISVTDFFRDGPAFEILCSKLLPSILDRKQENEPIRIWVAGCATGEEAYSIAICLHEVMGEKATARKIQIFATDISEPAIAKARNGIYKSDDLKKISPQRLSLFFTKRDGSYQVNKNIRETCIFAWHNMIKDPPFSKLDMVCCRNVLIYMQPMLQKKALTIFHYALREKSYLVLGKSETIGANTELFVSYNQYEKVYIKKGEMGRFMHVASPGKEELMRNNRDNKNEVQITAAISDVYKKADEILLGKYTPAGVLITENFDIVQFKGHTAPWLSPSPGKASLHLLKMAKEDLVFELRTLLHQAKTTLQPARKEAITVKIHGRKEYVAIDVVPIMDISELHYLVLFKNADVHPDAPVHSKGKNGINPLQERVDQLEKELAQNREDMRTITEDQEAAYEELQSINEELLSGSEELQTLNEELETSKEEMQSANEELISLNHELIDRNDQLNSARMFTQGIFNTIRDSVVLLEQDFKLINATKAFYAKFELTEDQAEGQVFFDLLNKQWDIPQLRQNLKNISEQNSSFSNFEISRNFSGIGNKILLLNGRQLERVDGQKMILMSIEDITDKRRVDDMLTELQKLNANLAHSNLELEQFAAVASHDLQEPLRKIITFANIIEEKKLVTTDQTKVYIDKMAFSARRMETIINDLLNYSTIAGFEKFFQKTDLNQIIANVLTDLEVIIHNKKAVINIEQLPVLNAVPLYMNQLFYNLFNNALKFSKIDVAPEMRVYSTALSVQEAAAHPELNPKYKYVQIVVADNGIGFEQEYADQVFNLFKRLNTRHEYEGTGIGLSLCRKIVLQHHGKIFAVSKENEGSSFYIILPIDAEME